jgi:hypothetical protein
MKTNSLTSIHLNAQINFYQDWATHLGSELTKIGYSIPSDWDARQVAMAYFNVQKRRISCSPRSFVFATDFNCPPDLQIGLDQLQEKSVRGEDINSYGSRGLKQPKKFDGLLFDWGIHHFHLGTTLERDGFISRTGPVLLAVVKNDTIYCIGIRSHGNANPDVWADKDLLEIIHRDWPELIANFQLDVEEISPKVTDEQYHKMRKAGLTMLTQLQDGSVFAPPGGGYMSAGNSHDALDAHDRFANHLGNLKRKIEDGLSQFASTIWRRSKYQGRSFNFLLERSQNGWIVREKKSGLVVFQIQES